MTNSHILDALRQIVPPASLITDLVAKKPFETEWRDNYSVPALAVILPQTIQQIQQIINVCQDNHIGIVPQGGNTSVCAGAIPAIAGIAASQQLPPQLILNLSKLNHILMLDQAGSCITVEAGCTLTQVQEEAAKHDLYFPLSIGSEGSCQIGGNIATNAGGIHVIKYGMMRDLVLGLEVVLPNGEIVNQLHDLRKNNINFDLKQLFIGSEGTLGIITKAVLKLFPKVHNYFTGLIGVNNLTTTITILSTLSKYYRVCAFEVINQQTQRLYNTHFKDQAFAIQDNWLILFELEIDVNFDIDNFTSVLTQLNLDLNQVILASNEGERKALWQKREQIPLAEKMAGFAVKHDISLPISKIKDFINLNRQHILSYFPDAQIIIFGHLGDGNLHYNIELDEHKYPKSSELEEQVNALVYADVNKYNGSFSAEHGIGCLKRQWMLKYYDPVSYTLAKSIKELIDPNNILNPNKIFTLKSGKG